MKHILTAFLLALTHLVAFRQTKTNTASHLKTGAISGCVTIDEEMVAGAIVTLEQGGISRNGTATNMEGIYCIDGLLPGKYDVNIRHEGMVRKLIRNIEVIAGDTTVANISMEYKKLIDEPVVKTYPFPYRLEQRKQRTIKLIAEQMDTVQMGTIAGRITDTDGEPMIGAIVHIELNGVTQTGTATDIDGNYLLTVTPGTYQLVAQYAGMKKVTVKCTIIAGANITCRNIKMEEESLCLIFSSLVDFFYPKLVDPGKPGTNKKLSAEQIEHMAW